MIGKVNDTLWEKNARLILLVEFKTRMLFNLYNKILIDVLIV